MITILYIFRVLNSFGGAVQYGGQFGGFFQQSVLKVARSVNIPQHFCHSSNNSHVTIKLDCLVAPSSRTQFSHGRTCIRNQHHSKTIGHKCPQQIVSVCSSTVLHFCLPYAYPMQGI